MEKENINEKIVIKKINRYKNTNNNNNNKTVIIIKVIIMRVITMRKI